MDRTLVEDVGVLILEVVLGEQEEGLQVQVAGAAHAVDGAVAESGNAADYGLLIIIMETWPGAQLRKAQQCGQGRLVELGPYGNRLPVTAAQEGFAVVLARLRGPRGLLRGFKTGTLCHLPTWNNRLRIYYTSNYFVDIYAPLPTSP